MRTRMLVALVVGMIVTGCTTEVTNLIPPTEPPVVQVVPVDCEANPSHEDCVQEEPEEPEEPDAEYISGAWRGTITDQGGAFVSTVWTASIQQGVGAAYIGWWASAIAQTGTMNGAVQVGERISGGFTYNDGVGICSGQLDGKATATRLDIIVIGFQGSCAPIPTVIEITAGR